LPVSVPPRDFPPFAEVVATWRAAVPVGDAEAAMADAFPGGAGVLVVSGTGSIAWACSPDGAAIRVGGWGQLLGDEGSGWDIALHGLRAVARASDGRTPPTALTAALLPAAGVTAAPELIAWSAAATKAQLAALAPAVLAAADRGDPAAVAIRDRAVSEIATCALTAARRTGVAAPPFALTGGLLAAGGPLRAGVSAAILSALPGAVIVDGTVDAALGAARLARAVRE
jgi:N-acetylglucosamine kinase-like BadF-type ATPase